MHATREPASHPTVPLIVRQDGHYGAGPYVWTATCARPGHDPHRFHRFLITVHTTTRTRSSARSTAAAALKHQRITGYVVEDVVLVRSERED